MHKAHLRRIVDSLNESSCNKKKLLSREVTPLMRCPHELASASRSNVPALAPHHRTCSDQTHARRAWIYVSSNIVFLPFFNISRFRILHIY